MILRWSCKRTVWMLYWGFKDAPPTTLGDSFSLSRNPSNRSIMQLTNGSGMKKGLPSTRWIYNRTRLFKK